MNRSDDVPSFVRFCPRHKFDVWQIDEGRRERCSERESPYVKLAVRSCRLRHGKKEKEDDEDEDEEEKEARWMDGAENEREPQLCTTRLENNYA